MESEVLQALQALKAASKDIESNSSDSGDSMNALLHLQTSTSLFHNDPKLTTLSSLLSRLKSHLSPCRCRRLRLRLRRSSEISRIANSISSELQSWIDRQLISSLSDSSGGDVDEERSGLLSVLESRLNQGFDPTFQDLLLKSNLFSAVQSILADADTNSSKNLRDRAAAVTLAFVRFNKHVFVGEVLVGPTVGTLVSVSSVSSIRALNGLIASIRSPLVDELHAIGGIKRIVSMLNDDDDEEITMVGTAFETVLEIGYCGRKEAVDAMIEEGLVERLVALERSERREFESCVARFSIEVEVGEGLRGREKRAVKMEVLRRVRKMEVEDDDDAVRADILAQVLWGPTLW